jgi:hypothetical protein
MTTIKEISRARRRVFGVLFIINLLLVGAFVLSAYSSAIEIVVFTLAGALVTTVLLSIAFAPIVALVVWLRGKRKGKGVAPES